MLTQAQRWVVDQLEEGLRWVYQGHDYEDAVVHGQTKIVIVRPSGKVLWRHEGSLAVLFPSLTEEAHRRYPLWRYDQQEEEEE